MTQFGELPNEIWIEELAKFSPRDIEFGIEQCKRSGSDFAPSLPRFLAYCTPMIGEDVYRSERETKQLLSRPRWQGSDDVKNAELAKQKNLLRFNHKPQEETA